jgi:hypothetical protein
MTTFAVAALDINEDQASISYTISGGDKDTPQGEVEHVVARDLISAMKIQVCLSSMETPPEEKRDAAVHAAASLFSACMFIGLDISMILQEGFKLALSRKDFCITEADFHEGGAIQKAEDAFSGKTDDSPELKAMEDIVDKAFDKKD